jgi:hypothetical protein
MYPLYSPCVFLQAGDIYYNVYEDLTVAEAKKHVDVEYIFSQLAAIDYKTSAGGPCNLSLSSKYMILDVQWNQVTHISSDGAKVRMLKYPG